MKMRGLNSKFFGDLKEGKLKPLLESVKNDRDLILEIRENYINIYYRGNNLTKVSQHGDYYKLEMNTKFKVQDIPSELESENECKLFVEKFPKIKERINVAKRFANEIECEQMLIRFNNLEKLTTEYYIIDRQIAKHEKNGRKDIRNDMIALYWPHGHRNQIRETSLAIIELKFKQGGGIEKLDQQLNGYFKDIEHNIDHYIEEAKTLLYQKLDLGLFEVKDEQKKALKKLKISRDPHKVIFGIILVDFNIFSDKFRKILSHLKDLNFSSQIRIFHVGYCLQEPYGCSLEKYTAYYGLQKK